MGRRALGETPRFHTSAEMDGALLSMVGPRHHQYALVMPKIPQVGTCGLHRILSARFLAFVNSWKEKCAKGKEELRNDEDGPNRISVSDLKERLTQMQQFGGSLVELCRDPRYIHWFVEEAKAPCGCSANCPILNQEQDPSFDCNNSP